MFIPLINNTCTIEKVPLFAKVEDDQDRTMIMWRRRERVKNVQSLCVTAIHPSLLRLSVDSIDCNHRH